MTREALEAVLVAKLAGVLADTRWSGYTIERMRRCGHHQLGQQPVFVQPGHVRWPRLAWWIIDEETKTAITCVGECPFLEAKDDT